MSRLFDELVRVRDLDASFLAPKYEECLDPFLLPDMQRAVERISQAKQRAERVLIYGDYDVDGVTASTVLRETLRLVGLKTVEVMLPNRFIDGYGMSQRAVERAKAMQADLVVTVDCGSRNLEVIQDLGDLGIDTIVTDHHECGTELPKAVAVINAKRRDLRVNEKNVEELLALREIAGVGVVFKLAQALTQKGLIPTGQEKWLLDLVAIGTICDSMQLTGENRRFCYYGAKVLEKTRRVGLRELMRIAGAEELNGETVGFQIGPRLNAAGRMDSAERAYSLLTAKTRAEAAKLGAELEDLNKLRKNSQQDAIKEIEERGVGDDPVIVVAGKWHEGVLGIVAGRLTEEYRRPSFVLAEVDGILKGSGRSFGEFSLATALEACAEQIIGGGGHAAACGVKLETDKLDDFRRAVNEYYLGLNLCDQERFLTVQEDLVVEEFDEISLDLMDELRKLEPYGEGNPEPVFLLPEVRVAEAAKLGEKQNHLRLVVWDKNGRSLKLMMFRAPEEYLHLQGGEIVNVWINLTENNFRGTRSLEGRILRLG